MIASRLQLIARRALNQSRQQIRLSSRGHSPYTYNVRGYNVPFKTENGRILFLKFLLFFGFPYWLPYLVVRHQVIKNAG